MAGKGADVLALQIKLSFTFPNGPYNTIKLVLKVITNAVKKHGHHTRLL